MAFGSQLSAFGKSIIWGTAESRSPHALSERSESKGTPTAGDAIGN
jgi:hypothetical protein